MYVYNHVLVARLDTNGCPIARGNRFQVGASKKVQTVATMAIASICSFSNFNDCHNRNRMVVASRASDKLRGKYPKIFLPQGQEGPIS